MWLLSYFSTSSYDFEKARSSGPEVFFKKGVTKIHRKAPVPESPHACNSIKKETLAQAISCEFCKNF